MITLRVFQDKLGVVVLECLYTRDLFIGYNRRK